jgi:hypothetical protein
LAHIAAQGRFEPKAVTALGVDICVHNISLFNLRRDQKRSEVLRSALCGSTLLYFLHSVYLVVPGA